MAYKSGNFNPLHRRNIMGTITIKDVIQYGVIIVLCNLGGWLTAMYTGYESYIPVYVIWSIFGVLAMSLEFYKESHKSSKRDDEKKQKEG